MKVCVCFESPDAPPLNVKISRLYGIVDLIKYQTGDRIALIYCTSNKQIMAFKTFKKLKNIGK